MQNHLLDPLKPLLPQLATLLEQQDRDLSNIICILPSDFLATPLRQQLKNQNAQLLPEITTLRELVSTDFPPANIIPAHQCSLLLAQLLKGHKHLYGKGSHWGLANNLLQLFDELSLQCLPTDTSWEDFINTLDQSGTPHAWFSKEAQLIYTLWQAWQQQMQDENWLDHTSAYTHALRQHALRPLAAKHLVFVTPNRLRTCEQRWLEQHGLSNNVLVVDYPDSNSVPTQIKSAPCQSAEQQALAVCLAVRDSINANKSCIVVGEDRRLTRRIHALLARFEISVDDKSGWTLSTTKIGACLEHWLQCIETDFNYQSLLDFLKSPYVLPQLKGKAQLCFRLEQDLVHHENISSNLSAYTRAIISRQQRLHKAEHGEDLLKLLDILKQAAQPLTQLLRRKHRPQQFLQALQQSLLSLQVNEYLENDVAGQQLLRLFAEFEDNSHINADSLIWTDFRRWFNQALEGSYFRPSVQQAQVALMTYSQAHFADAQVRIICSADAGHLPPAPPKSPFFKQQARSNLDLENKEQFNQRYYNVFKRLCHSEGETLITWQAAQDGEPIEASPWVKLVQQQAQLPVDEELLEQALQAQQEQQNTRPYTQARTLARNINKAYYSAGSHQRLINCPYHYFASDLLALKPVDEIREALAKSDYGSRIHLCLEALHHNINYLPGPFADNINDSNQDKALKLLQDISTAVFQRDTDNNFQHRSWLKRWLAIAPYYIQWQVQRQQQWQAQQFEINIDQKISQHTSIKGRIDRIDIDRDNQQLSIIDYKTGYTASHKDMLSSEDVQLSTYAFTLEEVAQCSYINLQDAKPVNQRSSLEGEELQRVTTAAQQRLEQLQDAILQGESLPAWGEQAACDRCNNAGICRRQIWA